jgi:hypothetical protein
MEASSQFAEWSAGQSQRVIKACRQLGLEHRKFGRRNDWKTRPAWAQRIVLTYPALQVTIKQQRTHPPMALIGAYFHTRILKVPCCPYPKYRTQSQVPPTRRPPMISPLHRK